jgi:hypothetical protein
MESARRASEIHKRRCGRSFRITEEAVLNEEMYEEEDPDYGQRVSRLYAAFAQDAAIMHQQWMHAQRIRVDQATGKFVMTSPPMDVGPMPSLTALGESVPFFAYKPGVQPSSTPIRSTQETKNGTISGHTSKSSESTTPSYSPSLGQTQCTEKFNQFQPSDQCSRNAPHSSVHNVNQSSHGMSMDMFEDNSNPYPAQLHLFTYPNFDPNEYGFSNNYDSNFNPQFIQHKGSGSVPQSPMPMSPSMMRSSSELNTAQVSAQYNHHMHGNFAGDQLRSVMDQSPNPSLPRQCTQSPLLPATMQQQQEHAFQNLRDSMVTSYEPETVDLKAENERYASFSTNEEVNDLAYDDWLVTPGSQG